MPQGVLFLAREEGGQGFVHLASRTATFRLQFIQRYLTGPADLVWRDVASSILRRANNLGLDDALFLTDSKFLKLSGLPPFYQEVFRSWAIFIKKKVPESGLSVLVVERTTCEWSQTGCQRHDNTRPDGGADPVWNSDIAAAGGCSGAGTQQHPGPGLLAGAAVHPGGPEDPGPLDPEAH